MSYASDTEVSVDRSRSEIESTLKKYGANKFAYMSDDECAMIGFVAHGRSVRFRLPLPQISEDRFNFTPARRTRVDSVTAYRKWEQSCRSKWRALLLAIKAKLEAVECGITTFEEEFLAHIVTASGRTIGEMAIPQIKAAGENPVALALEFGGKR